MDGVAQGRERVPWANRSWDGIATVLPRIYQKERVVVRLKERGAA
jgi:hypothetical protein